MERTLTQLVKLNGRKLAVVMALVTALAPVSATAAGLAPRSVQVGSSGQGMATSYTVNATTATQANIGSVKFEVCTTATGACTLPGGVVTTSTTLSAQSPNGFTLVNSNNGAPYITRAAAQINSGVAMSFTLANVTNPITANQSYFLRITTYTGTDGITGAVDNGAVAMSTSQPVQLTGVTPEILVFCVGTAITTDCTTVSGSTIDFGDFSPTATRTGTSVMQAQTNAANGYNVTVNGTTLSSGVNTIPALTTQSPSLLGVGQFGLNLRINNVSGVGVVGSNPSGGGSGVAAANYSTANQYRFNTGELVASAAVPTNANTFTSSYVTNIGGAQAAGVYTATVTYICTASF